MLDWASVRASAFSACTASRVQTAEGGLHRIETESPGLLCILLSVLWQAARSIEICCKFVATELEMKPDLKLIKRRR